jgi:hypothetical protein
VAQNKTALSTNNIVAIAAISSLIAVIVSFFLAKNLYGNITYNNKVIAKKTAANKQLELNVVAVESLVREYQNLGSRVQLVDDALPTKPDFASIIAMSEALAGASGVRLRAVTSSEAPAEEPVPGQPVVGPSEVPAPKPFIFGMNVSGNYDDVLKYLSNLELSSRSLQILSISHAGASSDQSFDVKLQTYYQPAADTTLRTEVVK